MKTRRAPYILLADDSTCTFVSPKTKERPAIAQEIETTSESRARFFHALASDPDRPFLILSNTTEQEFKIVEHPPLRSTDRNALLNRRLAEAFPNAPLTRWFPLGKSRAILSALSSPSVLLWHNECPSVQNHYLGVTPLTLVACAIMKDLWDEKNLRGWTVLIYAQNNGTFRQIVACDGQFVFTRQTPTILATDKDETSLNKSLSLQIKVTRDYLARHGLLPDTRLRVITLLPHKLEISSKLKNQDPLNHIEVLTTAEASQRLRLGLPSNASNKSAEVLLALWAGRHHTNLCYLQDAFTRQKILHYRLAKIGKYFAIVLWICLSLNIGWIYAEIAQRKNIQLNQDKQIAAFSHQMEKIKNEQTPSKAKINDLRMAVERQRAFATKDERFDTIISTLRTNIPENFKLSSLEWSRKNEDFKSESLHLIANTENDDTNLHQAPCDTLQKALLAPLLSLGLADTQKRESNTQGCAYDFGALHP